MTNQIKVNSKVVNFSGLRYVSEKPHYKLEKKAYIDKGPCGVGITTWCCSKANPEKVILIAPFTSTADSLLQDAKASQGKPWCVDKDSLIVFNSEESGSYSVDKVKEKASLLVFRKKPWKIITTGDSFYKLAEGENSLVSQADRIVVDETDDFLLNTVMDDEKALVRCDRNKASLEVLRQYQDKVSFVSSTQIDYQGLPEWIQKLTQVRYEFDEILVRPDFRLTPPRKTLYDKFVKPLSEGHPLFVYGDLSHPVKKIIVFMYSLQKILEFIKVRGLVKEDVRLIVGKGEENDRLLKRAGLKRLEDFRKLPKFTFVTRAGWRSISLEDPEALTVIVAERLAKGSSRISIDTKLSSIVHLYRDVTQIMGRNRVSPFLKIPVLCSNSNGDLSEEEIDVMLKEIEDDIVNLTVDCKGILSERNMEANRESRKFIGLFTGRDSEGNWQLSEDSVKLFKTNLIGKLKSSGRRVYQIASTNEDWVQEPDEVRYSLLVQCLKQGMPFTDEMKASPLYEVVKQGWQRFGNDIPDTVSQLKARLEISDKKLTKDGYHREAILTELKKEFELNRWYKIPEIKSKLQKVYNSIAGCNLKATGSQLSLYGEVTGKVSRSTRLREIRIKSWKE